MTDSHQLTAMGEQIDITLEGDTAAARDADANTRIEQVAALLGGDGSESVSDIQDALDELEDARDKAIAEAVAGQATQTQAAESEQATGGEMAATLPTRDQAGRFTTSPAPSSMANAVVAPNSTGTRRVVVQGAGSAVITRNLDGAPAGVPWRVLKA